MSACVWSCWAVSGRLVGIAAATNALARTPVRRLLSGVLAKVLGSSRARYFTLNASHFVVAAVCVAVLAIVACTR